MEELKKYYVTHHKGISDPKPIMASKYYVGKNGMIDFWDETDRCNHFKVASFPSKYFYVVLQENNE